MNKFMRLFALLLVVVAVVLVVLAFQMGGNDKKVAQTPARQSDTDAAPVSSTGGKQASYTVVTAATQLAPGRAIVPGDVKTEQKPYKVANGFDSVDAVVGRVPAIPVKAGSPLQHAMMIDDLSLKLLPGERAIAVPVSDTSGVGHHVHPGDYVDLFFTLKPRTGKDDWQKAQARLLLPRLRVLAYGRRMLPQPEPARATSSDKAKSNSTDRNRRKADTAVLAVPVDKVNRILLAEQNGSLSLALRSPTDPGMPDVKRFPQPSPVLIAEAVKSNKASDKTDPPGDPAHASSADNAAYAGIRLGDLTSGDPKPKRHTTRRHHYSPPHHRVDIIRGTERSHMTVYDQGGTP